jgi:replication initiation protein RepC
MQMTVHFPSSLRGAVTPSRDPRWTTLSKVQAARDLLSLRDRDIAVLRGLLSLIPAEAWSTGQPVMVYASNKVLSERCDGMEERTLRRRLTHLCECGLIRRHISPNRKRYSLRDGNGAILISYGFDLEPLRQGTEQIEALAEQAAFERQELRKLRAVLRDRLWQREQCGEATDPELRKLLRNKASIEDVKRALDALPPLPLRETSTPLRVTITDKMSDSDSEPVRDIQNSDKEFIRKDFNELTAEEVMLRSPIAMEYAPEKMDSWHEMAAFAFLMAQAIGLQTAQARKAAEKLGARGFTMAIFGILQAGSHIRHSGQYIEKLLRSHELNDLHLGRMFMSLTRHHRSPVPQFADPVAR